MHPCSAVEMRSHLSMCPTDMDRTGILRYGMVSGNIWFGMAGCGLVWYFSMSGLCIVRYVQYVRVWYGKV